jgi:hypothetical protein
LNIWNNFKCATHSQIHVNVFWQKYFCMYACLHVCESYISAWGWIYKLKSNVSRVKTLRFGLRYDVYFHVDIIWKDFCCALLCNSFEFGAFLACFILTFRSNRLHLMKFSVLIGGMKFNLWFCHLEAKWHLIHILTELICSNFNGLWWD